MWTISINSATNDGQTASYDESCSSTLASTFSNGKSGYQDAGVVSVSSDPEPLFRGRIAK
jgi:proprotein convertase subtilisin/kexin type 2